MSFDPVNSCINSKFQTNLSVVPWDNPAQFKKVYEHLYSKDIKKKRWAIDQISVWETRCHPSLPTAIEASLVISRAVIQDILLTNDASLCQEQDVQMMYSMALVRFVNLTIEPHQQFQRTVTGAQIAKGLGIPTWIVDLRNEATHSFWPSLPALRMAGEAAMKYLSDSYWEKEISSLKNVEKEFFNETEIKTSIVQYVSYQFKTLRDEKKISEREAEKEEFESIVNKITYYLKQNKRQFVKTLVSDGFFIPLDDDLKRLTTVDEYADYQEEYGQDYTGSRIIPPVPVELEAIWRQMLNLLNMYQAIPLLLEVLLKSQGDRTEMGKKLVVSWVMRILRIVSLGDCFEDTTLTKFFRRRDVIIDWNRLFHAAVIKPCLYTPYVFPLIFTHLDLSKSATTYILNLMAISLGQADWKSHKLPKIYSIHTVDVLRQMKHLQNAKKISKTHSDENIWSVVQDSNYKSWPIGFVINPVEDEVTDDLEDFLPIEYYDMDKMDFHENCFLSNENGNEEECIIDEPDTSEDEMESFERQTFLYREK